MYRLVKVLMSKKKKQVREVSLDIEHNEEFTEIAFKLSADSPLSPQDCLDAIADTLLYADFTDSNTNDGHLN